MDESSRHDRAAIADLGLKFTARKNTSCHDAPLVCHAYASVKALGPPEVKRQSWNLRLDVKKAHHLWRALIG
jgi:hypothetical protein